ncbi:MAG: hypothetical protein COV74_10915 [Candidatus Omnitrophica bacterium CG11_big_fil_rev_8_21_14_0_20_45_26]|uniref:Uncharacterized protein n=1 Tax=Candidatus Abzuiibacterium crystallinum TaxID=1974748 RepID=A0A2H0LL04_9BACT|nr:MAG: hypothetical protein COV74_10915 [Candidatus Omnitrophica bacterium CG11_big_fil_rev_8_21_14_0_20_45_26]PIW63823.1 MAG: hypothetical protein COW12_07895 [Candidatus Omnitrophica bacterium CG12_big_fil_rev_8_21_14_0_65_45_16]
MLESKIKLLQFLICKKFKEDKQDIFSAEGVYSNLYVPSFPHSFRELQVVTCWRKDERFHKEVIEYETDYGAKAKSPHMDIEPAKDSVIFRWHAHQFPSHFKIEQPAILTVRVVLDWKICFESYIMIEEKRLSKSTHAEDA